MPSEKAVRDHRIDALRGVALVSMMLNHLPGKYTDCVYELFGFSSFAEVFVLLSGVVMGYVYSFVLVQNGEGALRRKAQRRAGTIYSYHILIFLLLFVISFLITAVRPYWYNAMQLIYDQRIPALVAGFALLYAPIGANLLPIYVIFVFFAPLLITAIHQGRVWQAFVVTAVLWGAAQFHVFFRVQVLLGQYVPIRMAIFDPMAWWALFASGIFLGCRKFYQVRMDARLLRRLALPAIPVLLFLLCWRHQWIALPQKGYLFSQLKSLQSLGLLRLLNFSLWGIVLLYVGRFFAVHRMPLYKGLSYLGKHSLQVYSYHALVTFVLYLQVDFWNSSRRLEQSFAMAVILASLWIPAWIHARYQAARARKHAASRP